jgi:hypothetical protein
MKHYQLRHAVLIASLTAVAAASSAQAAPTLDSDDQVTPVYPPPAGMTQTMPPQTGYYSDANRYEAQPEIQTPQFGSGVNNDTNNTGAQVPGGSAGTTSLTSSRQVGVPDDYNGTRAASPQR